MTKTPLNTEKNLSTRCFDLLQEEIVAGTLAPGQKLTVDVLKEKFNVGQSPVREALARLSASGLLYAEDNKGFRVAHISEHDIRDVYQTFTQIEKLALTQAITNGDEAWQAGIVGSLYSLAQVETKKEPITYSVWSPRNYAFHVALITGCNSPLLLELRASVYRRFDRYCRMAFNLAQHDLLPNHHEHELLAKAVLARDVEKTCELINYHINEPLEEIIILLKKNNVL